MKEELIFVWSTRTAVLGTVLVLVTAVLCVWGWRRSGFSKGIGFLEALRLLLAICIALTLNQPEWREEHLPEQQPTVAVLWDDSRSMETQDIIGENGDKASSRESVVSSLLELPDWSNLEEKVEVIFESFSSSNEPQREATDLNAALEAALERHANLRSAVIISDGDWNQGAPPIRGASKFRIRGIPVFTVGIGSESYLPDLEIDSFDVRAFGVAGKPVRIPYRIKSTLPRDFTTDITLQTSTGEKVMIKDVSIPAMDKLESTIIWRPESTGDIKLTLSVPTAPGEINVDNNQLDAPIAIRQEQLKVLIIESFPRWEYRYLLNALERDKAVEVKSLLFHPKLAKVGGGRKYYLDAFPDDASLAKFDVVFLGDVGVGPRQLTAGECKRLKLLVRDQATGLVFLPGFHGNHYQLLETELADLYPVVLDQARKQGIGSQVPGRMELTKAGRKSLLTKLEDDEDSNSRRWRNLPGFQWHAAALRAKAGTSTLARHRSISGRFGRTPLIVTKTYGTGKILYMGTDGAWRWREGFEDTYHYRFWGQVALWMAYQRKMSDGKTMRLFYHPDRPAVGDIITLNANVTDPFGEPLQDGTVLVQVLSPSGHTESIRLLPADEESWGLFSGTYTPGEPGGHKMLLTADRNPDKLELALSVQSGPLEQVGKPARLEVLEEVAQVTNGRLLSPGEVSTIIKEIYDMPEPDPLERRLQIWAHPLWGGFIVLLLGIFWTGRKMTGTI